VFATGFDHDIGPAATSIYVVASVDSAYAAAFVVASNVDIADDDIVALAVGAATATVASGAVVIVATATPL
jgi:hypothetical protein